jgi:hypothetical protein
MNLKTTAAIAVVIGGLTAWFALFLKTDQSIPSHAAGSTAAPLDTRAVALAKEIALLRRHQDRGPRHQSGRDPFRFATHAPRVAAAPSVAPAPIALPAPPPRPALKLIGVAEDNAGGTPVRTAIIAAPDQLYVVKEGEHVTARYGVARISADVVELVDTADASAIRLALK